MFRMVFQMGDTDSDWTGVELQIDSTLTSDLYYEFGGISTTNENKQAGWDTIEANKNDNSDFRGFLQV